MAQSTQLGVCIALNHHDSWRLCECCVLSAQLRYAWFNRARRRLLSIENNKTKTKKANESQTDSRPLRLPIRDLYPSYATGL